MTEKKFEVYSCEDFLEAKEIISLVIFDLIILDRMMPSGDGIDLVEFIKENSNSPIIMLTAMSEDQNKIDDCNSQILKFVNEKKIEVVDR